MCYIFHFLLMKFRVKIQIEIDKKNNDYYLLKTFKKRLLQNLYYCQNFEFLYCPGEYKKHFYLYFIGDER